jgi:release factor glutamine methyltransferase
LRLETELLIADALNWNRSRVLAFSEHQVPEALVPALLNNLERLKSGEPYAYIVGKREFYGLEFIVTPSVLIPRPDTELIVELARERCSPAAHVVDLGTGSGAIAVSLAHVRSDLNITATDKSSEALKVAERNAKQNNCTLHFKLSDWYSELHKTYDIVLSNPPYIHPNDPHLPALAHEPQSALVANEDGMADLAAIIGGAPRHLNADGQLLVEHGFDQSSDVAALFEQHGFENICLHKDLAGQPRVTSGSLSKTHRETLHRE